jgi:hypothetical protein
LTELEVSYSTGHFSNLMLSVVAVQIINATGMYSVSVKKCPKGIKVKVKGKVVPVRFSF